METGSSGNQDANEVTGLQPWQAEKTVRAVSAEEARYASGFLRCRPERWFPGFSAQWLPLAHALSWDLRCIEIKPVIKSNFDLTYGFVASVDAEPIALAIEDKSLEDLINACVPGSGNEAKHIVFEYLARRLLQSSASVWSSAEQSQIHFEPHLTFREVKSVAAIDLIFSINGNNVKASVLLGRDLVDRFDGLWRRQLIANSKTNSQSTNLQIELAHLVVAPTVLTQYLKAGTDIDLDVPVTDRVNLLIDGQALFTAKMVRINERLGLQSTMGNPNSPKFPDGTTRLSIQMGKVAVTSDNLTEFSQPGAIIDCGFNLSDQVKLVVGNQAVGAARLKVYQGRYAITVV